MKSPRTAPVAPPVSPPASGINRIGLLLTNYATDVGVPVAEIAEWYRQSDDKPGLLGYLQMEVAAAKERRRQWFNELRPHGWRFQ